MSFYRWQGTSERLIHRSPQIWELESCCPSVFFRFVSFSLAVFGLSFELFFFSVQFFSTVLFFSLQFSTESIAVHFPKEFECWGGFILNLQFPILQRSRMLIVFRNNFLSPLIIRVSQQMKNKGVLYKWKVAWLCNKNQYTFTRLQQRVFAGLHIVNAKECQLLG